MADTQDYNTPFQNPPKRFSTESEEVLHCHKGVEELDAKLPLTKETVSQTVATGVRFHETAEDQEDEKKHAVMLTEDDVASETRSAEDLRKIDDRYVRLGYINQDLRERGKQQAPVRIEQFGQYLKIMEARVAALERKCDMDPPAKDSSKDVPETCVIADIRRCSVKTFEMLLFRSHAKEPVHDQQQAGQGSRKYNRIVEGEWAGNSENDHGAHNCRHVVEIQYDENASKPQYAISPLEPPEEDHSSDAGAGQSAMRSATSRALPQRLRIRGDKLLQFLSENCVGGCLPQDDPPAKAWVYPFLFICVNEASIRQAYLDLRTKIGDEDGKITGCLEVRLNDSPGQSQPRASRAEKQGTIPRPSEKEEFFDGFPEAPARELIARSSQSKGISALDGIDSETMEARRQLLKELEVVIKLLDLDLYPILDLYRQIRRSERRSIAFQDVWHLFKHGEEVRQPCEDMEAQIYRVWNFTGGRDLLSMCMDSDDFSEYAQTKQKETFGAFHIECYHYSFNGSRYAPSYHLFTIRRYDGLKEIKSLPLYPLRYTRGRIPAVERWKSRGESFKEMTNTTKAIHKSYAGLSLGEDPEEVTTLL